MLKLKIKNPQAFIEFLKRFSPMDKQILLEIENGDLKCKYSTIEKSIVKYSSIKLDDVFSWTEELPAFRIKVGVYNVDRIVNAFKQYTWNDDVYLYVKYVEINAEQVAQELILESPNLEMTFPCTSLSMFKFQLEDDLILNKVMNKDTQIVSFPMDKETQSKVLSLCSLDSDNEIISFVSDEKNIKLKGKSFNLKISDTPAAKKVSKISKNLYAMLDKENYMTYVLPSKIIFVSTESNTLTCIANPTE